VSRLVSLAGGQSRPVFAVLGHSVSIWPRSTRWNAHRIRTGSSARAQGRPPRGAMASAGIQEAA